MKLNKLAKEEERVIVHGFPEMPYSGEYDNFFNEGVYVCKRCGAPLYKSDSKFDAHCGWPAFDKEIVGAVKKGHDDGPIFGVRIECARCGADLGHVYNGEGFTKTNVRYCVNSISMKFIPKKRDKTEK